MLAFKSVLFVALSMGMVFADTQPLTQGLPNVQIENAAYPASVAAADVQYASAGEENEGYAAAIPSGQAFEGAVYDPNAAYAYASPEALQQYAAAGLIPYQGGYPVYPNPGAYNPGAYAVQSGYEGYLVPSFPVPGPIGPPPVPANFLAGPGPFDYLSDLVPLPRTMLSFVTRLGSWLLRGMGMVVAGGAITTGICTFTPLCSISFALPFLPFLTLRDTAKTLSGVIEFDADTADRVRRAADFVQAALEKYNALQQTLSEDSAPVDAAVDTN